MAPHGLHGPWPMGLGRLASGTPPCGYISGPEADGAPWGYISRPEADGAPWGYISGPEADGAPWAPWASGTPPWGYHLVT